MHSYEHSTALQSSHTKKMTDPAVLDLARGLVAMHEDIDVSSAEEDTVQRKRKRQPRKQPQLAPAVEPRIPVYPQESKLDDSDIPVIRSLEDLVLDHPHLAASSSESTGDKKKPAKKSSKQQQKQQPKDSSKAAVDELVQAGADKDAIENPLIELDTSRILGQCLSRLVKPALVDDRTGKPLSGEDMVRRIRQGQAEIPEFLADYESQLLKEAGEFTITGSQLKFPACMHGNNKQQPCVGMARGFRVDGQPERVRFVLTAFMYAHEYQRLHETGNTPDIKRPCVACHRLDVMTCVYTARGCATASDSKSSSALTHETLVQCFTNRCDVQGGYYRRCVTLPDGFEGLVGPLADFRDSYLVARRERTTGRWCVDQSAMIWKPPAARDIQIGDKGSTF